MWLAAHWKRVTPVTVLLAPLSLLYGATMAARRAVYRHGIAAAGRVAVPVIVVGNLSAGGTGKTPAVLWLTRFLRARGYRPGIVSRGYGGIETAPRRVTPDSDPNACGDEPVLLARRSGCEVWTGAARVNAARALLAAHRHCDVIVSDDGLQHYALARDLEVCVIDGALGFGNGWLLPAGPLREPVARLASLDAVLVNGARPEIDAGCGRRIASAGARRFDMTLEGAEFYNLLNPQHRAAAGDFRGRPVHAVAGIGNPDRFFRHLQGLGLEFVAHPFPDHHRYESRDFAFAGDAAVVMTEKDAVKCRSFASERHWVLPVDAVVDAAFGEFVVRKLEGIHESMR